MQGRGQDTYSKVSREKSGHHKAVPQCSAVSDEEDEQAAEKREVHGEGLAVGAPGVEVFCALGEAAEFG